MGDEHSREAEFGDGGEVGADVENVLAAVGKLDGAGEVGNVATVGFQGGGDVVVLPINAVRGGGFGTVVVLDIRGKASGNSLFDRSYHLAIASFWRQPVAVQLAISELGTQDVKR